MSLHKHRYNDVEVGTIKVFRASVCESIPEDIPKSCKVFLVAW